MSGKASGKTPDPCPVHDEPCPECSWLLRERIAELEAELADLRPYAHRTAEHEHYCKEIDALKARAEKAEARWDSCKRMLEDRNAQLDKAEAEVERLKKELKWAHRELHRAYPHLTFPDLIGVNPSGDTLGKERVG